jgi:hypothetical protein
MFHDRLMSKAAIAVCMLVCSGPGLAEEKDVDLTAQPMSAVWQVQRIGFHFSSTNIYYSCDGFRQKVQAIMRATGARNDVSVDLRCRSGDVINNAVTVITVATPIEATAENVSALTTYSSEAQLAARLNRVQLPTANDIERFPADWRKVNVNRTRGAKLEAGDCDLIDGLIEQVFPHLPIRVLKRRTSCSQGSVSRMSPTLHVAALMAAPVVPMAFSPKK